MTDAQTMWANTVNPAVTNAQAKVNTAAPGAVQSGIDFTALGSASVDFLQVAADAGNVFAETFNAAITETLLALTLASSIITNIETAILIGEEAKPFVVAAAGSAATAPAAPGGAAAPAATTPTVSSVLAQVQQQATANLTLVNTVFNDAKNNQPGSNLPAGFEAQVLGGQVLFQQDVNAFLNSLPSSLSPTNDTNSALISTLQNLLTSEQNLNTTLSQIETYDNYEQPFTLTGLNVAVVLEDAAILTDVAFAAITYAYFVYELLTGELVTVSATGAYTVNVPSGAKWVDIVLSGGGGGGGGYNTAATGGTGGDTTATPSGGSTLTAAGGSGGASSETATASAGGSPGNESFDGQTYSGGNGGAAGVNSVGGNGTAPGGGGGGGGAYGSYGGAGGAAGAWAAETIAIPSGMTTITGSVGAGGTGGVSAYTEPGGSGGNGEAFFNFYS